MSHHRVYTGKNPRLGGWVSGTRVGISCRWWGASWRRITPYLDCVRCVHVSEKVTAGAQSIRHGSILIELPLQEGGEALSHGVNQKVGSVVRPLCCPLQGHGERVNSRRACDCFLNCSNTTPGAEPLPLHNYVKYRTSQHVTDVLEK